MSDSAEVRDETTIEWEHDEYEAAVGEELVAVLTLRSPLDLDLSSTWVETSDPEVVRVLPGPYADPAALPGDPSQKVSGAEGAQDITLECVGEGTATLTAEHGGLGGTKDAGVMTKVSDTTTVVCGSTSSTTGTTGDASTSDGFGTTDDATTDGSDGSDDSDDSDASDASDASDGSTGGGPSACAMGETTAPNSRDITVSGVEISGEITGDAADCPMLLCSFTVTNNRDDYVTFGVLESTPDDEIAPMPIVSAVAAGESKDFEVWANDCTTPVSLDRTLFIHDEVAGVSLGEVPLIWQTSLP